MHEYTDYAAGSLVAVNAELEREFEARLVESSTLAFRVAFSVLRHRQDAEEVAQEAFVKAYRHFTALRDRDRFRAWLDSHDVAAGDRSVPLRPAARSS